MTTFALNPGGVIRSSRPRLHRVNAVWLHESRDNYLEMGRIVIDVAVAPPTAKTASFLFNHGRSAPQVKTFNFACIGGDIGTLLSSNPRTCIGAGHLRCRCTVPQAMSISEMPSAPLSLPCLWALPGRAMPAPPRPTSAQPRQCSGSLDQPHCLLFEFEHVSRSRYFPSPCLN